MSIIGIMKYEVWDLYCHVFISELIVFVLSLLSVYKQLNH